MSNKQVNTIDAIEELFPKNVFFQLSLNQYIENGGSLDYNFIREIKPSMELDKYSLFQYLYGIEYFSKRINKYFKKFGTYVDAGCGTGNWCLGASKHFDKVIGIDIRKDRIEIAKDLFNKYGQGQRAKGDFYTGSITEIPVEDKSVDACLCFNVLSVVEASHAKVASEFSRILRPGGICYITILDLGYLLDIIFSQFDKSTRNFNALMTIFRSTLPYYIGIKKQPSPIMPAHYLINLMRKENFKLLHQGAEGSYTKDIVPPIFPGNYKGLPFMREYIFESL